MSLEQLREFIAKAKDNNDILEKIKATKSPEEVASIGKDHGHEFNAEYFGAENLTKEELGGLSGGLEVLWISYCKPHRI